MEEGLAKADAIRFIFLRPGAPRPVATANGAFSNPNGYLVLKFRIVVSEYSPLALKDQRKAK
jgi:hypothetical protein